MSKQIENNTEIKNKIILADIKTIKLNPDNPRIIKDDKYKKLVKSIQDFPQMLEIRPIVVNSDMVILGGNMRLRACQEAGLKQIPIIRADDLTEEQQKEFIIKDNIAFGEWNWDCLGNEWDELKLDEWGLDVFGQSSENRINTGESHKLLSESFVVPPFSIFDTRQGYWKDRKKFWKEYIKDGGEARTEAQANKNKDWENKSYGGGGLNDTSLLDPVMAEIVCKWFGIDGGINIDPFAGDSYFGAVSGLLDYKFVGIELREEQVDFNQSIAISNNIQEKITYICDDGENIQNHIEKETADLLFSCPPYWGLEKYNGGEKDLSGMGYGAFLSKYKKILHNAIECLKNNRFAVIVIGDVRDKKGNYINLIADTKNIMIDGGCDLYNEIIQIDPIGNGMLRAGVYMKNRKVVKMHQNVLVFFKGDNKTIKDNYKEIEVMQIESTDI